MSTEVSLAATGGPARTVLNTPEALASLKAPKYGDVFRRVEDWLSERLEAEGQSQKRVCNFRTARNGWMRLFGLSEESPVGVEFGSGFTDSLERYLMALAGEGKSPHTIADRKSMMRAYREAWVSMMQSATAEVLEGDFARALNRLIESSGTPAKVIARAAAVGAGTFVHWRQGRSRPSKRFLPAVHRLEEIFGLPVGALASKLPRVLFGGAGRVRTGLTGHRKHASEMTRMQYVLREFPPTLQGEWGDVLLFYTDAAWLRTRGLQRNSKWRIREHDNRCPTADHVRNQVSEFVGYLCLPADADDPRLRGKGFRPEELTMALLSDSDLIYGFLQFKRERTYLKRYNTGTSTFLSFSH